MYIYNINNIYDIYTKINRHIKIIYKVRLPNPWSGDSQGQETFLAPSADTQIRNYDTECSNHHRSLSTLKSKELSCCKMKW